MERQPRDDGSIVYTARARWTPAIAAAAGVVVGAATWVRWPSAAAGAGIATFVLAWMVAPRVVLRVDPSARRIVRTYANRVLLDVPFDAIRNVSVREVGEYTSRGNPYKPDHRVTTAVVEIGTDDEDITLGPHETEKHAIDEAKDLARALELDVSDAVAPLAFLAIRKSRSP